MANFVALLDPSPQRRAAFERATLPLISPLDGLEVASFSNGRLLVAWAASARAPVSSVEHEQGAAVIWGDAFAGGRGPLEARELPAEEPLNGFHAALHYDATAHSLQATADPLGVFPVYYWTSEEAVMVASSPELFRRYERFHAEISPEGLTGILLTGGLIGGRALIRGVRRLDGGSRLRWSPQVGAEEQQEYRPAPGGGSSWRRQRDELERLDAVLASAVSCQAPAPGPYGLLLSGGRDSRMLAGYLQRSQAKAQALAMGVRGEHDPRLARRVAGVIGAPLATTDVSTSEFPAFAEREARWCQLANGFNGIPGWGQPELLRALPPRVVSGYGAGSIAGGITMRYCYPPDGGGPSFDAFFDYLTGWGVRPAGLKGLLRREAFGDGVVEHVSEQVRSTYAGLAELEPFRSWCFDLQHRQRFNSGGMPWRQTFGGWPVMPPSTDRRVIDCAADTSVAALADRVLQDAILAQRFPRLAAISVNGVGRWPSPIRPTGPEAARRTASHVAFALRRRLARRPIWWGERYARIYDFNGPGWRAVRRHAEPYRELAHELLDPRALAQLVPAPDASPRYSDMIANPSASKTLVGLMIWLGAN